MAMYDVLGDRQRALLQTVRLQQAAPEVWSVPSDDDDLQGVRSGLPKDEGSALPEGLDAERREVATRR